MPIIDMSVEVKNEKAKKLSKEEETKLKVEKARAQIVKDQQEYEKIFNEFVAAAEQLPTYYSLMNAIKKACYETPNQIIETLLKESPRHFPDAMKQMRAQLYAEIIARMDKK